MKKRERIAPEDLAGALQDRVGPTSGRLLGASPIRRVKVLGEPRERPILFSGPMIRAILEGRKTQTRRVVRTPPGLGVYTIAEDGSPPHDWGLCEDGDPVDVPLTCHFGVPGDRLWVRETFGASPDWPDALTLPEYDGGHNQSRLIYRADEGRGLTEHYGIDFSRVRWFPSIYMPRWASRITLRVTSVRVERLQDISEEDAIAEGVEPAGGFMATSGCWQNYAADGVERLTLRLEPHPGERFVTVGQVPNHHVIKATFATKAPSLSSARESFTTLWDSINGKRPGCAWRDNPFVWAVGFEVERRAP